MEQIDNLIEMQRELQKDAVKELEEKIKDAQERAGNSRDSQKFIYSNLIKKISKDVYQFKYNHFKEVFRKVVKSDRDYFNKLFKFKNKNIENFISTPLSKAMVNKKDKYSIEKSYQELKESNINFQDISFEKFKKIVKISEEIYKDRFNTIFKELREDNQYTSALLYFISSELIAYILTISLFRIQAYENEKSDEFNLLSRQNRGDELFKDVSNYIKDIDISIIEDKERKIIAQNLIDILIDLGFIEEYNQDGVKSLIYIKTTEKFENRVKDLKYKSIKYSISFPPMVIPPIDWKDIDDGGFLKFEESAKDFNLLLIKHNRYNRYEEREIKKQKGRVPKELLDGINTLQKTPFRINSEVLKVIKSLKKRLKSTNYYKKVEFYKNIADSFNTTSKVRLKELMESELNKINRSNRDKRYIDIVIDKFNNRNFWIDFKAENKLAKLQRSLDILIKTADRFMDLKKIYFVWQIDFRGRVYPVQTLLNPQGGDVSKSLLLFDKAQKLNDRGLFWFKIHGANLYGEVDKEIFEKRVEWIDSNSDKILHSANNPLESRFWKEADEPFEFLAFCFEYKRFIENPNDFSTSLPVAIDGSNNGLQHISTLLKDIESAKKVNVLPTDRVEDIYKFIAETLKIELERERDKFEKVDKSSYKQVGKLYFKKIERFVKDIRINAINLIEKIEPLTANDVKNRKFSTTLYITGKEKSYLDEIETEIKSKNSNLSFDAIKKRIIRELNRDIDDLDMDVEDGNLNQNYEKRVIDYELIEESMIPILFENIKIDRKFVKKPVMTDSYGSSQRGKADDIFEEIYKLIYAVDIEDTKEAEEYIRKFSLFLAKKIEDAISKNSKASVNYEKFIKKIASYILKKDRHIYWYTPIGFKVQQFELKTKPAYINLKGNGKIKINIFQNEIDKREHKKGILPNFIHSLDATHLYKTINSVKKKGIDYFMTVHDSFATLPNDMDTLSQTLREEFINLYSEPILEHLIESINREFNMDINIKVPYVDKKEFNLEDIRDSKYFFA